MTPGEAADYQIQLEMLNARANSREPGALKELKAFIEQHPEVWESIGDLSAASRIASITRLAGADSALREAVTRNLDCWMEELIGSNPTPIERAIREAAVSAKLAMIYAETHAASGNDSVAVAAMKARRLERAQNRFNATLKNLAQVQRMSPRREMAAPVPLTAPPLAQAG